MLEEIDMKSIFELGSRIYQTVFKWAIPILPYREPIKLNSATELVDVLKKEGIESIILVTDAGLVKAGIVEKFVKPLQDNIEKVVIYDKTVANPTIANIMEARKMYEENNCRAIIGLGGGSAIDCAKGLGASIARPNKDIRKMKGILKVMKKLPLLVAVPTTAGTGSETTLAAVITDEKTHFKYPINDFVLIPQYAILDPKLTVSLPPHITSTTGMDALTHAVEAYIGRSATKKTKKWALEATELIYGNIYEAYSHGDNLEARTNMLQAAYLAGLAFTVSYVGYVHAIAHSLGGKYGVPHGLANAILLPYLLKGYGPSVYPKLKELALVAKVAKDSDSEEEAAKKFIKSIEELNAKMNIPTKIKGIKEEDIPDLAIKAAKEANPLYPVPVYMNAKELEYYYHEVMEK